MEWLSLTVLDFFYILIAIENLGTRLVYAEEKKILEVPEECYSGQAYYCINSTHYSPCTTADSMFAEQLHCEPGECCQKHGESPCTPDCPHSKRSLDFLSYRRNLQRQSKASEEVERLNRIVSVKNVIIREKDVERWREDASDYESVWKPSYRAFCPVRRIPAYIKVDKKCKLSINDDDDRDLDTTTVPSTAKTTTPKTTTKSTTTRTTTAATKEPVVTTDHARKTTTASPVACTESVLNRKYPIPGTCQDYLQCVLNKRRKYVWKIRKCPPYKYFFAPWQMCRKMELVPCDLD